MYGDQGQPIPTHVGEGARALAASLSGRWLLVARIIWVALAAGALMLVIAALPQYARQVLTGRSHYAIPAAPGPATHFFAAAGALASLSSVIVSLGLSGLLFRTRFAEPVALLLSFFLLGYGVVMGGPLEYAIGSTLNASDLVVVAQSVVLFTPTIALFALFPNGRFVPGWARWLLLLSVPWNLSVFLITPFEADTIAREPILFALVVAGLISFYVLGLYAQVYRYRHISTEDERQQTRWAVYGFGLWIGYILLSSVPYLHLSSLQPGAPIPWWMPASQFGWWSSLNILPLSLTIAVTRYRLWDIDLVINRTLVYGSLMVLVVATYTLLVGGIGLLLQTQDNRLVALLATGLAAVLFQPVRVRLQQGVNRMMYGERDQPFEVLARLGERLENTLSPELVYPTIVETVSQALKLPYAAVVVPKAGGWRVAQSYGRPTAAPVIYPLTYHGETVGRLLVAPRAQDEPLSAADQRLLRNIARQAGTAVHAVQLMADLQHSRRQLVTTREEERRRLRRDLHDGLGPLLASQMLTIEAIEKLLTPEPDRARALLRDLKSQSQSAVQDIRRVVYALRPPALDELGLVGALRESVARQSRNGLHVVVEAPALLPALPAAVEVAAYRVAQEAITNVVRHAGATKCTVTLALEKEQPGPDRARRRLRLEIVDNGWGLPPAYRAGVGLQSMHERAVELGGVCQIETQAGGGVRAAAFFPLTQEPPAPDNIRIPTGKPQEDA